MEDRFGAHVNRGVRVLAGGRSPALSLEPTRAPELHLTSLPRVGFHDPHRPYESGATAKARPPARVTVPPYLVDSPETRKDLVLYYDEIGRMDEEIGRLSGELDRRKLRDNTLIVFLSDNGAPFPREKGTL